MGRWTYMLKFIRCGKPTCRCMNGGLGHGPYWYAAQHTKTGVKWRYIGRVNPEAFDHEPEYANNSDQDDDYQARWTYKGKMTMAIALRILGYLQMPHSLDAIKRRWRVLVSEHHPDRGGDTAICGAINAAYNFAKKYAAA